MNESMYIGATGMHAQQVNLDTIANNLANINTAGFKKNRVNFEDLMYRVGNNEPISSKVVGRNFRGVGTGVQGTGKIYSQGEIKNTENPLDVAIKGRGFFEVVRKDGSFAYTRNGSFRVGQNGLLSTVDGYVLSPSIIIPSDSKSLTIKANGAVEVTLPNQSKSVEVGKIQLAYFNNNNGLIPKGGNIYIPSQESGAAFYGQPSKDGMGELAQRFVETSNVKITEELINMIMAQRAYEINSKVVQTSDELLGMINNMRR